MNVKVNVDYQSMVNGKEVNKQYRVFDSICNKVIGNTFSHYKVPHKTTPYILMERPVGIKCTYIVYRKKFGKYGFCYLQDFTDNPPFIPFEDIGEDYQIYQQMKKYLKQHKELTFVGLNGIVYKRETFTNGYSFSFSPYDFVVTNVMDDKIGNWDPVYSKNFLNLLPTPIPFIFILTKYFIYPETSSNLHKQIMDQLLHYPDERSMKKSFVLQNEDGDLYLDIFPDTESENNNELKEYLWKFYIIK